MYRPYDFALRTNCFCKSFSGPFLPLLFPPSPPPIPKETRRKRFDETRAVEVPTVTAMVTIDVVRGCRFSTSSRLTIEAFEIAISTERKVIATLVTGKLMPGRNGKAGPLLPFQTHHLHPPSAPSRAHCVCYSFFGRRQIGSDNCESRLRQSRPRSSVQLALRDARFPRFSSAWSITVVERRCHGGVEVGTRWGGKLPD